MGHSSVVERAPVERSTRVRFSLVQPFRAHRPTGKDGPLRTFKLGFDSSCAYQITGHSSNWKGRSAPNAEIPVRFRSGRLSTARRPRRSRRSPVTRETEGSCPSRAAKFGFKALKVKQSALTRQSRVRFSVDPPGLLAAITTGRETDCYSVLSRFESGAASHFCLLPGLSSGDGASPTKKISGVRSSTPVPFFG